MWGNFADLAPGCRPQFALQSLTPSATMRATYEPPLGQTRDDDLARADAQGLEPRDA